jgi:hypothetical protein
MDSNLEKGFIIPPSSSPATLPILLVKKQERSLKPCINYWKLN